MSILLTGSGGFIGSNLKNSLKSEYNILAPRSFELDLTDFGAVRDYFHKNNIDLIIHCGSVGGARGKEDETDTVEKNLSMVNNLINSKKENVRIILFGSGAMYGKSRSLHKVKEKDIGSYTPKDLYGLSKLKIAEIVPKREDILCLNIFACYGYGEKTSRFPSYAIIQNINCQPIVINQDVVFDYLFIEDFIEIVKYFIKNNSKDKIVNVTPTQSIKLSQIAGLVNEISDYKSEIIIKNNEMNNEYTGDNSILLDNIKDFEFTPMMSGLKKLYDYIKTDFENDKMQNDIKIMNISGDK